MSSRTSHRPAPALECSRTVRRLRGPARRTIPLRPASLRTDRLTSPCRPVRTLRAPAPARTRRGHQVPARGRRTGACGRGAAPNSPPPAGAPKAPGRGLACSQTIHRPVPARCRTAAAGRGRGCAEEPPAGFDAPNAGAAPKAPGAGAGAPNRPPPGAGAGAPKTTRPPAGRRRGAPNAGAVRQRRLARGRRAEKPPAGLGAPNKPPPVVVLVAPNAGAAPNGPGAGAGVLPNRPPGAGRRAPNKPGAGAGVDPKSPVPPAALGAEEPAGSRSPERAGCRSGGPEQPASGRRRRRAERRRRRRPESALAERAGRRRRSAPEESAGRGRGRAERRRAERARRRCRRSKGRRRRRRRPKGARGRRAPEATRGRRGAAASFVALLVVLEAQLLEGLGPVGGVRRDAVVDHLHALAGRVLLLVAVRLVGRLARAGLRLRRRAEGPSSLAEGCGGCAKRRALLLGRAERGGGGLPERSRSRGGRAEQARRVGRLRRAEGTRRRRPEGARRLAEASRRCWGSKQTAGRRRRRAERRLGGGAEGTRPEASRRCWGAKSRRARRLAECARLLLRREAAEGVRGRRRPKRRLARRAEGAERHGG